MALSAVVTVKAFLHQDGVGRVARGAGTGFGAAGQPRRMSMVRWSMARVAETTLRFAS